MLYGATEQNFLDGFGGRLHYDLMVFERTKAPTTKKEFMAWYEKQTEWEEGHDYQTISVSSPALQNWFLHC